ncbi:MAG: two-component sensor histidine kinase [Ignavibacteria bacterium GWA2_54_16]|nr:MAG: two-component sensor histidine kinase [Ignavibacteria bacterium GWA2_54_16]
MVTKLSRRIGFKLIVVVGLTMIITIGVYSYFNTRSQRENLLAEVERHAMQLSETVKNGTRYDMLFNQRERIHIIINDIGSDPAINEVRVLNKEGEIIYSSRAESIGRMVDKQAESCYGCHAADKPLERLSISERTRIFRIHPDSARVFGVINPIYSERSCWDAPCHAHSKQQQVLGVLDVTISLADVDERIRASTFQVGIFAVSAILAASLIIAFFVNQWVSKPVGVLLDATKQVGSGNLSYTVPDLGKGSIGLLAQSFNTMTMKLSEARLQLFQSDKMASLGRLAAGIAHEINNPLTGVLTYASFLLKRSQNNPELHEDLKIIVRETIRSREIVKSLLDFARQSIPKKSQSDINEIIDRSVAVVEHQLAIKGLKVVRKIDPHIPKITLDPNQMQQVFVNLLVNAADAIEDNTGAVTIASGILRLPPQGIVHIKAARCPSGHDLITTEYKIEGMPAIRVKARSNGDEGFIMLDPIYGLNRHRYEFEVLEGKQLDVVCPECNVSLMMEEGRCPVCGSNLFSFSIPAQGDVEFCIKPKCAWQRWATVDSVGKKVYAEVCVADTGVGIPKEDLSRIFEPFFTTKGQKGTGLGLAVIWGIIDNHNGTISVESEVGSGTTFRIRLPIS